MNPLSPSRIKTFCRQDQSVDRTFCQEVDDFPFEERRQINCLMINVVVKKDVFEMSSPGGTKDRNSNTSA